MNEEDTQRIDAIRKAYEEAAQMRAEVSSQAAAIICTNLPGVRQEIKDCSGKAKKNMILGAGLLAFGILVTWISAFLDIQKGSWYYIIALGPIFAGLGFFVEGAFDFLNQF